jgi:hypothetical protein
MEALVLFCFSPKGAPEPLCRAYVKGTFLHVVGGDGEEGGAQRRSVSAPPDTSYSACGRRPDGTPNCAKKMLDLDVASVASTCPGSPCQTPFDACSQASEEAADAELAVPAIPATGRNEQTPLPLEEDTTTVKMDMSKCMTRNDLQRLLDESGLKGLYDFLYLAVNFETGKNYGYATVNFVSPEAMRLAENRLRDIWLDATTKITFFAFKVQGRTNLIENYRNKGMMFQSKDKYKPVIFQDGQRCWFPPPDVEQPPTSKTRRSGNRHHRGNRGGRSQ